MMRSLYSGLAMLALILALVLALGSMAPAHGDEEKPKPVGATIGESDGWPESIYDPDKHDQIRVKVEPGLCVEDDPRWVSINADLAEHNRRAALNRIESRLNEISDTLQRSGSAFGAGFRSGVSVALSVAALAFSIYARFSRK